jgi:hypothetical protein
MSSSKPVFDWATDFDYLDPPWVANPYSVWDALGTECPIPHSDRYLGTHLPTRYEDIRAIAGDTDTSHRAASFCAKGDRRWCLLRRSRPIRRNTKPTGKCWFRRSASTP